MFEFVSAMYETFLNFTSSYGISEPVLQSMLVAAILAASIYLTLYTGMFALANAGFMAIGAYVGVLLTQQMGLGLLPSLLIAMLVAGLIAIPIGLPVLRLSDIYLAIATIGFAEVVRIIILNFDNIVVSVIQYLRANGGEEMVTRINTFAETSDLLTIRELSTRTRITFELVEGARGVKNIPVLTETWMLVLFLVIIILFLTRLHRSRFGRAMAAIRQDEMAAANMGINVVYVKNIVFIMSAMLASSAGVFEGHLNRIITPDAYGFTRTVDILAYAVIGGTQTLYGPLVGGMVLEAIPEVLREFQQYRGVLVGVVMLGVIVYLPNGIVDPQGIRGLFGSLFSSDDDSRKEKATAGGEAND
ncbi:MAG: branched-chain amino acid ABC transporter permease [Chloroflexota bacterium]